MKLDWQIKKRGFRQVFIAETPRGRVMVKQATTSTGTTVWRAYLPDGRYGGSSVTQEAAQKWVEDNLERL